MKSYRQAALNPRDRSSRSADINTKGSNQESHLPVSSNHNLGSSENQSNNKKNLHIKDLAGITTGVLKIFNDVCQSNLPECFNDNKDYITPTLIQQTAISPMGECQRKIRKMI